MRTHPTNMHDPITNKHRQMSFYLVGIFSPMAQPNIPKKVYNWHIATSSGDHRAHFWGDQRY